MQRSARERRGWRITRRCTLRSVPFPLTHSDDADYHLRLDKMLAGTRAPKFISYICEQGINCGGLGDRYILLSSSSSTSID